MERARSILVTVGSTRFDSLVDKVLSTPFLQSVFKLLGPQAYVLIQYGHSAVQIPKNAVHGSIQGTDGVEIHAYGQLRVFLFAFTSDLRALMESVGLVISHCGT